MANVLFKRGNQAALNALKQNGVFQEGTFYLTTDTDRLYFAQSNNELVDLNQYIRTVKTFNDLPSGSDILPGDFFYIEDTNILCIRNSTNDGWTQLNPDTILTADTQNVELTEGTNSVTVKSTVTDSQNHKSIGTFTIAGGGVITVEEDPSGTIKISAEKGVDTTYTLGKESYTNETTGLSGASVVLTNDVAADSDEKKTQKVNIVGDGIATVSQVGDEIVVNAAGTNTTVSQLEFDANGALQVKVNSSTGTATGASVTPTLTIGESNTPVKFVNGTADLPVYTMTETDNKIAAAIQTADAMTYKGVVDSVEELNQVTSVNKGDTYKANFTGTVNGQPVNIGDLIISKSADGTTAAAADWDVVASGNDQLIAVVDNGNGLKITDNSQNLGAFTVTGGDSITVTNSGDNKTKEITVSHAAPLTGTAEVAETVTTETTQDAIGELVIPVVDSISLDKNGHVTDVKLQQYKVVDTHLKINSAPFDLNVVNTKDAKNNVTDSEATIGLQIKTGDGNVKKQTITLESNTLVFEETADAEGNVATSVNLVWGSF